MVFQYDVLPYRIWLIHIIYIYIYIIILAQLLSLRPICSLMWHAQPRTGGRSARASTDCARHLLTPACYSHWHAAYAARSMQNMLQYAANHCKLVQIGWSKNHWKFGMSKLRYCAVVNCWANKQQFITSGQYLLDGELRKRRFAHPGMGFKKKNENAGVEFHPKSRLNAGEGECERASCGINKFWSSRLLLWWHSVALSGTSDHPDVKLGKSIRNIQKL